MVFLMKKIYHPASEIPRCVKFNDKLSLDNCILLVLRLIGDPLCSHVMVGSGLGVCRRVTENEVFSFICFVLFRVEVMYTTGGTGERGIHQGNKVSGRPGLPIVFAKKNLKYF